MYIISAHHFKCNFLLPKNWHSLQLQHPYSRLDNPFDLVKNRTYSTYSCTLKSVWQMDDEEYTNKYVNLRILKSIQEFLKSRDANHTTVYPIKVPDDLLYQLVKMKGAKGADSVIHQIFRLGLSIWSEKLYSTVFGSQSNLEDFIELVKKRNKEDE